MGALERRPPTKNGETALPTYELVYIADPDLEEAALTELADSVKSWIEASGGSLESVDAWGKRKLAYSINKKSEGVYYVLDVQLPGDPGSELERQLRLSEQVLRYMITTKQSAEEVPS